jgi:hypothetical protein
MCDGSEFHGECRLALGLDYDMEALAVNGRSEDSLFVGAWPQAVLSDFLKWLGEPLPGHRRWMLAGQNVAKHDFWFLRRMASLLEGDFDKLIGHRTIDLHSLALACETARVFPEAPERGWTADAVFQACGLDAEPKPHMAITGAAMTAHALRVMNYRMGLRCVTEGGNPP